MNTNTITKVAAAFPQPCCHLQKNHRTVITRFPDCILILIHWLLSTSVHWEPNCNKHLKKPLWWALWSGTKLNCAWNCLNPTGKATPRGLVWFGCSRKWEPHSEWFRNTTWRATPTTNLLSALHPQFPHTVLSVGDSCRFPSFLYLGMAVSRDTFTSQLVLRCIFSW